MASNQPKIKQQKLFKGVFLAFILFSAFASFTLKIENTKAQTQTLGKTTAGQNSANSDLNSIFGSKFTAQINGNITKISAYIYCSSSGSVKATIYSDTSGTPSTELAESQEAAVAGDNPNWVDFTITLTTAPATVYWLCLFSASSITYCYDAVAGNQFAAGFANYPNTPTTFPTPTAYSNSILTIYATYATTQTPTSTPSPTQTPTPTTSATPVNTLTPTTPPTSTAPPANTTPPTENPTPAVSQTQTETPNPVPTTTEKPTTTTNPPTNSIPNEYIYVIGAVTVIIVISLVVVILLRHRK